jgi:hypothetical protein
MELPDDLPEIIFYRCGSTSRPALPRKPVESIGSNGETDAAQVCPQIPYGCDGWRIDHRHEWKALSKLPAHWMPFLNRVRPSLKDPRPKA